MNNINNKKEYDEYDYINNNDKTISIYTLERVESYVFENNLDNSNFIYELNFKQKILLICNIFRSFVGFGILVLPKATQSVGLLGAILGFMIAYSILYYGLFILSKVADKSNFHDSKYELLVNEILGYKNKIITEISIIILQIGTAIPSVYLSTRFVNYILCLYNFNICNKHNIILIYGYILSFPMIFIKSIKSFSIISAISTIIILISIISIIIDNFIKLINNKSLLVNNFELIELKSIPLFIGICLFAAEGIGLYVPLRNSVKDNYFFKKIYNLIIKVLFVVYIIFSLTCSFVYGKNVKNFIFFSIDKSEYYLFVLGILYASSMFLSFPLVYFPIYSILENTNFFNKLQIYYESNNKKDKLKFLKLLIRFICLTLTYLVVLIGPNILAFLSLIGTISTYILMIYFPTKMFNSIFKNNQAKKYFDIPNKIFLSLGSIVCLIIFINSIINLF